MDVLRDITANVVARRRHGHVVCDAQATNVGMGSNRLFFAASESMRSHPLIEPDLAPRNDVPQFGPFCCLLIQEP